jgi:chromosome segregation protein
VTILDSGVQIIAQPPGKKNSSIHLLSVVKSLGCAGLCVLVVSTQPCAILPARRGGCPLDDSNTERFCNLVRKMSLQTQFVFISHNKITMEMAQQLIGITMQEKGVSRVVAVEMADAARLSSGPSRAGQAW